uniref:Uncharacterized protein n=1 Tax=Rhizophora mucronata TaxID=61149 RepID=A0A2P2PEN5_RHIMU
MNNRNKTQIFHPTTHIKI